MRLPLFVFALSLAACTAEPSPAPAEPAPPTEPSEARPPTAPATPDPLTITTDDRTLATRPTAPLRVEGACPFEGCTYGRWTTSAETAVYATAGDTTSLAFTVPAETVLDASGGFVLLTRLGESVALRPGELFLSFEETRPLAEGDTLVVLDYEGEGSYRVWFDGQIGFSGAGGGIGEVEGADLPFRQLVAPASQWWARVTLPDGRAGWLWMDRTPSVDGADVFA